MNLRTNPTDLPKQYLMLHSDSPFQDITQNLRIHKPSHARDWWLLHHWPEIIVYMENFPSWSETLQKSHLIVPISTFQMCRTSDLKWDSPSIFCDGMYIVWVILSHEYRCFQCRRNKQTPNHRAFVDVLHCIFWRMVQYLSQSAIHIVQERSWS